VARKARKKADMGKVHVPSCTINIKIRRELFFFLERENVSKEIVQDRQVVQVSRRLTRNDRCAMVFA